MTLIIANWKAYITDSKKAGELAGAISKAKVKKGVEIVICSPFVYLPDLIPLASRKSPVKFGAQDVFWESEGAYTGEITTAMLEKLGVKYAIVGHSERRNYLGETDEMVNKKVRHALKAGLTAVLCVGEKTRDDIKAVPEMVAEQVRSGLAGLSPQQIQKVVVAYEPIWAIGTGVADTPDDALSAALYIKKTVADMYGAKAGQSLQILYGGSVNARNASGFANQKGIGGLLIGKASSDKKELLNILTGL